MGLLVWGRPMPFRCIMRRWPLAILRNTPWPCGQSPVANVDWHQLNFHSTVLVCYDLSRVCVESLYRPTALSTVLHNLHQDSSYSIPVSIPWFLLTSQLWFTSARLRHSLRRHDIDVNFWRSWWVLKLKTECRSIGLSKQEWEDTWRVRTIAVYSCQQSILLRWAVM